MLSQSPSTVYTKCKKDEQQVGKPLGTLTTCCKWCMKTNFFSLSCLQAFRKNQEGSRPPFSEPSLPECYSRSRCCLEIQLFNVGLQLQSLPAVHSVHYPPSVLFAYCPHNDMHVATAYVSHVLRYRRSSKKTNHLMCLTFD